jgi:hypothetical protein
MQNLLRYNGWNWNLGIIKLPVLKHYIDKMTKILCVRKSSNFVMIGYKTVFRLTATASQIPAPDIVFFFCHNKYFLSRKINGQVMDV